MEGSDGGLGRSAAEGGPGGSAAERGTGVSGAERVPGGSAATTRRPGESGTQRAGEADSYYGRPILKEPVWTWEIPTYFFTGGLAGASATLGLGAELASNRRLARSAWSASLAGVLISPPLLISDLGRPARFLNMLRMFKLTSPMSVGSWVLAATGATVTAATARSVLGRLPRLGAFSGALAGGVLGPALATYTGVLLADTAIPVWHEARRFLPIVFAGSAMGAAGATAVIATPVEAAAPARRVAIAGAVVEVAAAVAMERHLGELGGPYREGKAGRYSIAAKALAVAGAALLSRSGRRSSAAVAGGAAMLAGSLCERFSVYHAGFQSARDPGATVAPQRARLRRA
jgi:formate-dependent nitrite reductase membrane component NrfD